MISTPATIAVSLRTDESGVIHIGQTRITLAALVSFFKQGQSPETLHEGFPTL